VTTTAQGELARLKELFGKTAPRDADYASVRLHRDVQQVVSVRQDVLEPLTTEDDVGAMVTVHWRGGLGYGATADVSEAGLKAAFASARRWAERTAKISVTDYSKLAMPVPRGAFASPVRRPWASMPLKEKVERLTAASRALKVGPKIVDWSATLWHVRSERTFVTSGGGEAYQDFDRLIPMLRATANEGNETETRTFGHMAWVRQQGLELLESARFFELAATIGDEALQLLAAPNCPSGAMDLVLAPDQMVLQIHESIGHPLELDRILGDERNYAGTSFVTADMFGRYQYGSPLLNVTFDPTRPEQAASYAFDDDGLAAERQHVIKDGLLVRPLGGSVSQARAGLPGVANARADSWRRPPIDRMANLNVEPGRESFDALVGRVQKGVFMRTNCSWSIDDSRNKFQFGCEWGQLIENGKLGRVVKKPNYRGISASFWRGLAGVGDASTFEVLGTPYCGKGEPNQGVFVGHASPACLFTGVDVFGGE
jgi:predicted Zn-dependent protease